MGYPDGEVLDYNTRVRVGLDMDLLQPWKLSGWPISLVIITDLIDGIMLVLRYLELCLYIYPMHEILILLPLLLISHPYIIIIAIILIITSLWQERNWKNSIVSDARQKRGIWI